jgi:hypothetical protein
MGQAVHSKSDRCESAQPRKKQARHEMPSDERERQPVRCTFATRERTVFAPLVARPSPQAWCARRTAIDFVQPAAQFAATGGPDFRDRGSCTFGSKSLGIEGGPIAAVDGACDFCTVRRLFEGRVRGRFGRKSRHAGVAPQINGGSPWGWKTELRNSKTNRRTSGSPALSPPMVQAFLVTWDRVRQLRSF